MVLCGNTLALAQVYLEFYSKIYAILTSDIYADCASE